MIETLKRSAVLHVHMFGLSMTNILLPYLAVSPSLAFHLGIAFGWWQQSAAHMLCTRKTFSGLAVCRLCSCITYSGTNTWPQA